MSKIKVLDEQLCNRIAAGEVVERPASVVKELVENSIDAGATYIRVAVERGGVRLIRVADNGCGMDADDALLCLEQHGTSKISTDTDLANISTLGFRGEALPSIASVSSFTLRSAAAEDASGEGVEVKSFGGKLSSVTPCGMAHGTEIEVRDLFFNVPARRKFLRTQATEEHHIEEVMLNIALCYPAIGFELKTDSRTVFASAGAPDGDLSMRIKEFFGKNYASFMWKTEHIENNIRITGFTAAPGFTRNSRREQRTFVNGRKVDSPTLYGGIREGYSTIAEHSGYPPVLLFIEMPPGEVDVNVHPAKREVRFKNDYAVSRAVASAIRNALKQRGGGGNREETAPETGFPTGRIPLAAAFQHAETKYVPQQSENLLFDYSQHVPPSHPMPQREIIDRSDKHCEVQEALLSADSAESRIISGGEDAVLSAEESSAPPLRRDVAPTAGGFDGLWPDEIYGIWNDSYIVGGGANGIVLVDQHAAHERIMFEKLLDAAQRKSVASQRLLLPRVAELPISQLSLLLKNRELFAGLGFEVEPMGGSSIMLSAMPSSFTGDPAKILSDMLSELVENAGGKIPVELHYIARAACKAAVKFHDKLTLEMAANLVSELKKCRQGTLCPHGRPTLLSITGGELMRRFGRK